VSTSIGKRRYVISFANYEGGLTGLNSGFTSEITAENLDFKTDFSIIASERALNCVSGVSQLIAVGGTSEVVSLFNLQT
jgi:hypothetical protein